MRANVAHVRVRRLNAQDIAAVDPVLRAAYGIERSYRDRIEAYLRQRGALPLVAEYDGRVAGTVCGNDYGPSAYVSLMGVDPALHRRGIGDALMTALLAWCDERGFRDVRLDATDAGAPLYERFGFADFGATVIFTREGAGAAATSAAAPGTVARSEDAATIARLDAAAFGADRSPVLEPLVAAHGALVHADGRGYAVVQRNAPGAVVGPWVALDAAAARALLDAALAAACDEPVTLFIPSGNAAAVSLATAAGFVMGRTLRHMIRGTGAMPSPAVFGRANLGQG